MPVYQQGGDSIRESIYEEYGRCQKAAGQGARKSKLSRHLQGYLPRRENYRYRVLIVSSVPVSLPPQEPGWLLDSSQIVARIESFFFARNTRVDAGKVLPGTPVTLDHHSNVHAFPIENGTAGVVFLPLDTEHDGVKNVAV
jgi:hypothetical protein